MAQPDDKPAESMADKLFRAAMLAEIFMESGQEARQAVARAAHLIGVAPRLVAAAVEELRAEP